MFNSSLVIEWEDIPFTAEVMAVKDKLDHVENDDESDDESDGQL